MVAVPVIQEHVVNVKWTQCLHYFVLLLPVEVQNQIPFLQQDNQYQEQTLKHQYRLIL